MNKTLSFIGTGEKFLEEDLTSLQMIISQYGPSPINTKIMLTRMLEDGTKILIAKEREENKIIGLATLHVRETFFGLEGLINILVSKDHKKKDFLRKEMEEKLIEYAEQEKIKIIKWRVMV